MKTLLLLLALVLGLYLAKDKVRSERSLMMHPTNHPEMLVGPTQLVSEQALATFKV